MKFPLLDRENNLTSLATTVAGMALHLISLLLPLLLGAAVQCFWADSLNEGAYLLSVVVGVVLGSVG